jgi:peptidoglycan/LPS O-acetylase OafA/YrhL
MNHNQHRSSAYIPTLDGWRAIAVISVIVDHARQTFIEAGLGSPGVFTATSWGGYGVDLFFAISGFLICSRLLREWTLNGQISLKNFYIRRAFRILPLYWTYLLALLLMALASGLAVSGRELGACLLFFRNYLPCSEGLGTYTSHFWSLAVEEHFYLLWPFLLVLFRPRLAFWITPVLALLIHGWRSIDQRAHLFDAVFHNSHVLMYWRTDVRLDALLWGCFAALFCHRRPLPAMPTWLPWLLLSAVAGAIVFSAPALPLLLAVLFPILILSTAYGRTGSLSRLLELSAVRWIGRLSYSLYIWQTLFLQSPRVPDPQWFAVLKHFPINIWLIVLCSVITHYLVERPMIHLGQKLTRSASIRRERPTPLVPEPAVAP